MTVSMTGFGRATSTHGGRHATVEARSVNHRHLVVKWRLPSRFTRYETRLEEIVRGAVARGSLEVNLRIETKAADGVAIDVALARRYGAAIHELDASATIDWAGILALPGVVATVEADSAEDDELAMVEQTLNAALVELVAMRTEEGARLAVELLALTDAAQEQLALIEVRAAGLPALAKSRLEQRLSELLTGGTAKLDGPTLEREAAMIADRCDVREEIARLRSHFAGFRELLAKRRGPTTSIGRTLDFQVQEMGRETNTIGSKLQDAEATKCVVALKTAVERLREQVQNVE